MNDEEKEKPEGDHMARFAAELAPILEHMAAKINEHDDHIQRHESYFNEIGDAHKKSQIDGLKTAHGERFNDILTKLQGAHQALGHPETADDFWPALHDKMKELGIGKDQEGAFMDHVHGHLTKSHDAIYGKGMESPAAEAGDQGSGEAPAAEVKIEAAGEPNAVEKAVEKGAEKTKSAVKEAEKPKSKESPAVGSKEYYDNLRAKKPLKAQKGA